MLSSGLLSDASLPSVTAPLSHRYARRVNQWQSASSATRRSSSYSTAARSSINQHAGWQTISFSLPGPVLITMSLASRQRFLALREEFILPWCVEASVDEWELL